MGRDAFSAGRFAFGIVGDSEQTPRDRELLKRVREALQ
jgi:hypothetical protein